MDASAGSGPDVENKSVFMTPGYTYWIYFLMGCLSHFGMQLFVLSNSIFTDVLEIPSRYCGSFLANMVALSIMSCYAGFFTSHLLFPLHKPAIEYSFITACVSLVMLCLVNIINKTVGKYLYFLCIISGCFSFGVIECVGISSLNDPGLPGKASRRVIMFICGHPIGYLLVLFIHLIIEHSWFSGQINSCGYVGAIYSAYGIIVWVLLGVPIVMYIINYMYPLTYRIKGWTSTTITRDIFYYDQALKYLKNYVHYIVVLIVIEVSEIVLNWRIVLFLHDPYPKFDSIICSISIVMGYAIFDFVGRGFAIGIRRMVADLKDKKKWIWEIISKVKPPGVPKSPDDVEKGIQELLDQDPEVKNEVKLGLYRSFLVFTWLPISFRIITGFVMFAQRHYPENLALNNYTNLQGTIMLTMINALIRGAIVSYVYSNLYDNVIADFLRELKIKVFPKKDEPRQCTDMRFNANVTAALVVSIVRFINLTVLMAFAYIFYKYNRLLFDVSDIFKAEKKWPTDHLTNDIQRFWWWAKNIMLMIWSDIKSPFNFC